MLRFVLLLHECPDDRPRATHCDLMLEAGSVLQTWVLSKAPRDWSRLDLSASMLAGSNAVEVERIADHRLAYLEYEGPISGGRGSVRRLDSGSYQMGLTPNCYSLAGNMLRGEIEITSPSASDDSQVLSTLTFRPAKPLTDR